MLTLLLVMSVCTLPVLAAANVTFDAADIKVTDAAQGIITVSSNLEDTVTENRYVTVIVLPNSTPLSEYAANTLALSSAIVDLNGDFFSSFKFEEATGQYDFYVLYEGVAFGPVVYNFISATDAATVVRNIANGSIPKDSIVPQIQAANNGLGVDFTRFPVGFNRDLFIYRMDKARAKLTGTTDAEVLTSFNKLVDEIEEEIKFVKEVNAITYSGDYIATLQAGVKFTGIDFAAYNALDESMKLTVTDSFLTKTFNNADEIKKAFDDAVTTAGSGSGSGSGLGGGAGTGGGAVGPVGGSAPVGGGETIIPSTGDRQWPDVTLGAGTVVFTDIANVAWAKDAIEALAEKGILAGTGDGIFEPNGLVTREQFAKMIVLATDKFNASAINEFTDIPAGNWSAAYVASAKAAGYVNGIGEGKFGYGASISREDMAVMIYNVLKSQGVSFTNVKTDFADYGAISDYAKEAVGALSAKGIINGVGDNMFAPKATATRAQAALLVYAIVKGVA